MIARPLMSILSRLAFAFTAALILLLAAVPLLPAQDSQDQSSDGFSLGSYKGHANIEVGYRWVSDTSGNYNLYRSMINLGEGPKLLNSDISLRSEPGTGMFDRLDLSMNSWGGDPYNTMHLSIGRTDLYQFRADYRNLKYFNFIPTYSNPLLVNGSLLGQHSLDVSYRSTDLELKLFPNSKVRPYVAYSRSSSFGPGFTTSSFPGNEFLLNTNWQYASDEYRGGLELSLPRLVLTLEQGYQLLRNDSSVVNSDDSSGNRPPPFLGENITLDSLNRGYHDRTTLPVTRVLAKFVPLDQLHITGKYIYSMTDVDSSLTESTQGNFISLENRLIYMSALDFVGGKAKSPNHNGSFLVEFFPFSRLSISQAFDTRNYHVSGSALLATLYSGASPLSGVLNSSDVLAAQLLDSYLDFDRFRVLTEVQADLGRGFAVRAGHRYSSLDTTLRDTQFSELVSRSASVTQQTGIAGIVFRNGRWLHLAFDYEKNSTDHALTRTSLLSYDQLKFDWRFSISNKLSAAGRVAVLRNSNPQSDIDFSSHNRNYTVGINYTPTERFSLNLDYSRTNIYSDIAIIIPQTLSVDRSLFDERGHGIGGSLGVAFYRNARIDFGYRGILNTGSFPLNYHQPFASISIPLHKTLAFKTYWQYFGYNEKGLSLQDHKTHLVTFSLAYSR